MNVIKPYDQLYTTDKKYILMKSGRAAGKSFAGAQKIAFDFVQNEGDIFVARAYGSDLQQSTYQDILNIINQLGLFQFIETRTRPLKIINRINGNKIHFMGIGGSDIHRTKGFTADKPLQLIVVDELQQVESEQHLKEALDSVERHLFKHGKVIFMFNPDRNASHWLNEMFRLAKMDTEYLTIETTYLDIADELNESMLKRIEYEKEINPTEYKHRYLGETEGLFGTVYSSFSRNSHLIDKNALIEYAKKVGVYAIMVGADPASTKDATALVPTLLLSDGRVIVTDYFYHDPKRNGVITNDKLAPMIVEFMNNLLVEWKVDKRFKHSLPIQFIFDSNAVSQDLRRTLDYISPKNYRIEAIKQKKVIEMAEVVRSSFNRNLILISDGGGYTNPKTGHFMHGDHPLVTQLEHVVWNDSGDGFDKNVPNDLTDALTYATVHYFRNKGNQFLPNPKDYYKPLSKEEVNDE